MFQVCTKKIKHKSESQTEHRVHIALLSGRHDVKTQISWLKCDIKYDLHYKLHNK